MRALLDTQALIWFASGDRRMPQSARRFIASQRNELLLSIASAWEIMIKAGIGKLQIDRPPSAYLLYYIGELSLIPLPISLEHVFAIGNLPKVHSDPIDRLLIAQATAENLPIVTGDSAFAHYNVKLIW